MLGVSCERQTVVLQPLLRIQAPAQGRAAETKTTRAAGRQPGCASVGRMLHDQQIQRVNPRRRHRSRRRRNQQFSNLHTSGCSSELSKNNVASTGKRALTCVHTRVSHRSQPLTQTNLPQSDSKSADADVQSSSVFVTNVYSTEKACFQGEPASPSNMLVDATRAGRARRKLRTQDVFEEDIPRSRTVTALVPDDP